MTIIRAGKSFYVGVIACSVIGSFPLTSWSADLSSSALVNPRMVVSAGIGYESGETSTITVKTYDADNGTILSEDTYELNVKEDAALADNQPRERIFAGGVSPGTDGLSAFMLRAYDPATGQFLWEGVLNLEIDDHEIASSQRIVAHLSTPKATVTRIHNRSIVDGQPYFSLRAIDSATGQLMWVDHFSIGNGLAHAEPVSRALVGQADGLRAQTQQIEFRVRMMGDRGRKVLWEDMFEPTVEETDIVAEDEGMAEILPAWRGTEGEETNKDMI